MKEASLEQNPAGRVSRELKAEIEGFCENERRIWKGRVGREVESDGGGGGVGWAG